MKRATHIATILLAAFCILSVPLSDRFPSESAAGETGDQAPEQATLAFVDSTSAVLAGVALHKDFFREEGLIITPRRHSFGKVAMTDVLEGRADFATVGATPVTMAIMNGEKIFILATIQTSSRDNAIVTLLDSGIGRPSDLKGKRIAATFGTSSDFFIDAYLSMHGIGGKNVDKVNLRPELLQDALVSGVVDAVSAFQPFLVQMEKSLAGRLVSFYDKSIYSWNFNIVAKQDFIRANPGKVKKLLRALIRAEQFVQQQPEEAQKIVADYSGVQPELVRAIWPNMRFKVSLNQILVLTLEDQTRWAISSGVFPGKAIPNYLDFIYLNGLGSIDPKAVRILR